ncbi:mechanosensitive ion channel domain-containing protein [Enterococcus faecium]
MFSNSISRLTIPFEKPIRIGDTETTRNLTGTVTTAPHTPLTLPTIHSA